MKLRIFNKKLWGSVLILILFSIPLFIENKYVIGIVTFMFINALLASSCWFIMTTGQVTLGHAGFSAIGGYLSAAFVSRYGLNSWLSLLIALAVVYSVALIIGYITLRMKGIYFIVATLAWGEVIRIIFSSWRDPFGGLVGIMNLPPPDSIKIPFLYNIEFTSKVSLYYLTLFFSILAIIIMHRIYTSPVGLIFQSIRQSEDLAESVGINTMKYKLLAFVIGSIFAGLGGVLYTYNIKNIQPSSFTLLQSTNYLLYVAIGGSSNIAGPIIGAFSLNIFSEFLRPIREFEPIVFALILIVTIILFRGGFLGFIQEAGRRIGEKISYFQKNKVLLNNIIY